MIIGPETIRALGTARIEGARLFLTEQLDRKAYTKTNEVLEALGGKWSRRDKAHVFPGDPSDAIDLAICSGEISMPKDVGFFPTPPELAQRVVEHARIKFGQRVLEPSAGRGALATIARLHSVRAVVCVELLDENVKALRAIGFPTHAGDFLALDPDAWTMDLAGWGDKHPPGARFDRVVMNPPFGKSSDVRHVLHAERFLTPDGRLVAIMSAGVTFRRGALYDELRAVLEQRGSIEKLPSGSFKEAGTMAETVLVAIDGPEVRR